MTRHFLTCLCLFSLTLAMARETTPPASDTSQTEAVLQHADMAFILYLMSRGEHREALFVMDEAVPVTAAMADSLSFYRGWALYQQKMLRPSATALSEVSASSPLYQQARFFAAYNLAHTGDLTKARSMLAGTATGQSGMLTSMKQFQLGGMALLARDYEAFVYQSAAFTGAYQAFAIQETRLHDHYEALQRVPSRSPVVAAMLSAAIPGLGKIYAGKTGEGLAGFFYTMTFMATAYDFYRGSGPQSALFILSASVAGIFYAGNIWGSAVSVHRKKHELYHEIDQRILFDLHIPLRNAFN